MFRLSIKWTIMWAKPNCYYLASVQLVNFIPSIGSDNWLQRSSLFDFGFDPISPNRIRKCEDSAYFYCHTRDDLFFNDINVDCDKNNFPHILICQKLQFFLKFSLFYTKLLCECIISYVDQNFRFILCNLYF